MTHFTLVFRAMLLRPGTECRNERLNILVHEVAYNLAQREFWYTSSKQVRPTSALKDAHLIIVNLLRGVVTKIEIYIHVLNHRWTGCYRVQEPSLIGD